MRVCIRQPLTANRTYYVRTDGNDNNSGLVNDASGAFLTIQRAVDVIYNTLDLAGFDVTIQVGDGTYSAGAVIVGPQSGKGGVTLQGNVSAPSNVVISTPGNAISLNNANLVVKDMELKTTATGVCLHALMGSFCSFQNLRFGTSAVAHIQASSGAQVRLGNYTILGSAPHHLLITHGGIVYTVGNTVTLTGTPNWSGAFVTMELCGTFRAEAITFSGTATGKRYNIDTNSAVQTYGGGVNYFPGNLAGTTPNGGQYV